MHQLAHQETQDYSAAGFASLRKPIKQRPFSLSRISGQNCIQLIGERLPITLI